MERTLILGLGLWVGGAGAWALSAGLALAPRLRLPWARAGRPDSPRGLQPLDMIAGEDDAESSRSRSCSPSRSPQPVAMEEQECAEDDDNCVMVGETPLYRPEDASDMLSDSQRRRLAPVNQLRRKRRSRKVRVASDGSGEKFVPLVAGARPSEAESILRSFAGEDLQESQRQGEDYWIDPELLQESNQAEAQRESRRDSMMRREANATQIAPERLREEIVAPYKVCAWLMSHVPTTHPPTGPAYKPL